MVTIMNKNFILSAFADEAAEDLQGQIDAMLANGVSMLELRGIDGKNVATISKDDARKIRGELDRNGLKVWAIGSPSGKIELTDDFAPHLDSFKHMIELAGILGASSYRLFSFYGTDGSTAARDTVMERLSSFCEAAKGSGITLCHENEKDIYGESAASCLDIHRTLPELRAVFDPANFIQSGQETIPAWDMLADYVEYLHIKDAKSDGAVVPAGYGDGNVGYIVGEYAKRGGKVLTMEPHLSVFKGLDELEHGAKSEVGSFSYSSSRAAFDASIAALRELLAGGRQA